jgi:transcriptional regulator with XRE-family HTH domain
LTFGKVCDIFISIKQNQPNNKGKKMSEFQTRLQELMQKRQMTQRALAIRLNVGEATVSKYMNTDRLPRMDIIANIATALDTTTDYLLGRDEQEEFNYMGVKRLLARNANNMSIEEKRELIEILFGKE